MRPNTIKDTMDDTSVVSFILLQRKGLERLNATRTSVAAEGSTEANHNFLLAENANRVLSSAP